VAAPGGDQALTRHSQLKDITTAKRQGPADGLVAVERNTARPRGPAAVVTVGSTPMMYMESGWPNIIQALDLTDPDHPKSSGIQEDYESR